MSRSTSCGTGLRIMSPSIDETCCQTLAERSMWRNASIPRLVIGFGAGRRSATRWPAGPQSAIAVATEPRPPTRGPERALIRWPQSGCAPIGDRHPWGRPSDRAGPTAVGGELAICDPTAERPDAEARSLGGGSERLVAPRLGNGGRVSRHGSHTNKGPRRSRERSPGDRKVQIKAQPPQRHADHPRRGCATGCVDRDQGRSSGPGLVAILETLGKGGTNLGIEQRGCRPRRPSSS